VLWKLGGVGIDDGGEPRRSSSDAYTAYCSFEESVNVFKKRGECECVQKKEESVTVTRHPSRSRRTIGVAPSLQNINRASYNK
jgi:hypothetical protein